EPVDYPSEAIRHILVRTLGVPLFQEQAMKIAIDAAGFSPAKADKLRRALATFKRSGTIDRLRDEFIDGMTSRDYPREFAERCFQQIEGFADYGCHESRAASFALLVFASCWFMSYSTDVSCAPCLNPRPMGFCATTQRVRGAPERGVESRAVGVNHSACV